MYKRRTFLVRNGLLGLDVAVSAAAFLATFYVRQALARATMEDGALPSFLEFLELPLVTDAHSYQVFLLALPFIWGVSLYISGTTDFRISYGRLAVRYARAVAIGLGLFVTLSFLMKVQPPLARSFVVMFGVVNVLSLVVARYVGMETIAFFRHKRVDGHRMVIVGCGEAAVTAAQSLKSQPAWNVRFLGHVCVPEESKHPAAQPVIGELELLAELLDGQPVDEVLFIVPGVDTYRLAGALNACDERGVDVLLPLPPAVPAQATVEIASIDGYDAPLLGLRRTPTNEALLFVKRLMDIFGALVALTLASPVMIAVAIGIKLSSKGPVMFRQIRSGRNGRTFTMYKFRSMVQDAEARRAQLLHLNEMSGPVFKITRDPRVTRIGAFIRKTSLDELPQLFNILFGDMSLVGPRPPLPSEVKQYKPWQRRRLSVKPGLTGLWQVSGRNNIDFEQWMALDLRYIDNWSLWLDLKILLKTFPAVVLRSGAS
ncbi:sugar transferase [Myxococcota bacterium]|nr:sugar transferase [Myxococcota bacterium]